jgi:tetratricopeptide (TPR) repeat protein
MGTIYFEMGEYRQAMECLQQNLTALQGEQRHQFFGAIAVPSVLVRTWLVRCLIELGEFADGVTYCAEALQLAEAVDRPFERLAVYSRVGYLHVRQGTLHQAILWLERAMALSQDANIRNFGLLAPHLALAYALAGRATDALAVLAQCGGNAAVCGEAYLLVGCVEEAHRLAQRGLDSACHRKRRGEEAQALWLLGEIAMRRDSPDVASAAASYQQALALAEELGMRPLQAHCHHGLGRLYHQTGRAELARVALSAAIGLYRAMAMTLWLPQAEAAMVQVEGQP